MKLKLLLTTMLVACASTLMAQTHGVDGYYNYTAKQMQTDGVTFPMFSDGRVTADKNWWNPDAEYDGDYVKFVMGVNSVDASKAAATTSVKYYNDDNKGDVDESYFWRVSFKWLPKDTIRITKNYPVVAWKFSLPANSISKAYTDMFCEFWINNIYTGKEETVTSHWYNEDKTSDVRDPIKPIGDNGRISWVKYPDLTVAGDNSNALVTSMDFAQVSTWGRKNLKVHKNGYIYDQSSPNYKIKGTTPTSMMFIRLPQTSNEKAEFLFVVNYAAIKDADEDIALLDKYDHIGIPRQHFNFSCYADIKNASGEDKTNDERPVVYLKWMKTFKNLSDLQSVMTDANNWGDGTDAITLDENDSYGAAAATYSSVTLDRPLKADRWNTFCVPFNMSVDELGSVKELTGVENDGENYTLTFSDASSIVAGKPYLVKPTADIETLSFENLKLSDDAAGSTSVKNGDVTVTMYGNYDNSYVPEGAYFISNNKFYLADKADYVSQKAYRAFITIEGGSAAKQLLINADGQATAISKALSSASDAKADVYSISGVRVAKGAESLSTLPQGIYIVGGKKVIK